MKKIKFVDIFSGAGGLSLGLKLAGMIPIAAVEILPHASITYEKNIPIKNKKHLMITDDITKKEVKNKLINFLIKNKVDLIAGGFPCQGFSMAGKRIISDPRNSLYKELVHIVKMVRPKYLFFENVKGIISMKNGQVIKQIINDFNELGYEMKYKLLISSDYKVPQNRERVIFLANNVGEKITFPKKLVETNDRITIREALKDIPLDKEDIEWNHIFTVHKKETIERLSKIKEGKSLYENYSDAWKRPFYDKPSPTVKENHGATFVHPARDRVMTPRELARLQSFPDDFIFYGNKSNQLVQLGNAVPVLMAKEIGEEIIKNAKSKRS